jgi:hypothetical protein
MFEDDQAFEAWWSESEPDADELEMDEADREFEAWWASEE